ncbi:hypothetical protein ATY30_18865 [Sinorhizobium americanum]|nr:hypothetical protein ATY30_18865 [Sinorhizobium americanum]
MPCLKKSTKKHRKTGGQTRVMSDDQVGGVDKRSQCPHVDELSGHHLIGDACQPGDFARNGNARLPQTTIEASDVADVATLVKREGNCPYFDDLILAMVEPGCFGVEDDALQRKFRPNACDDRAGFEFLRMRYRPVEIKWAAIASSTAAGGVDRL